MTHEHSKLVYSTDSSIPEKKNFNANEKISPIKSGHREVIIRLERKGRGGKAVTLVECLMMNKSSKMKFLKQLKVKLGTGGTIKDNSFEFQGDHCDRLTAELKKMGYKPKRSGG